MGLVVIGASIGLAAIAAGGVLARLVAGARDLVTPPPPDRSGRIVAIGDGEVTLTRNAQTALPGRYGMWTDSDRGYAKVGEVIRSDARTVTRELLAVEDAPWAPGLVVRMGAAFYRSPSELDVPVEDVLIRTPVGPAPAWRIPADGADADQPDSRAEEWAILVHGRDAVKWETIRAVPMLRAAGMTTLIVSYRNDPGAPRSPDGKYHLGDREWYDVEAAIAYALSHGATRITLVGWSMGGATVLQTLRRSPLATAVHRVILDSPAIDWRGVIRHILTARGIPAALHPVFLATLSTGIGATCIGLDEPIDLERLDGVAGAGELRVPILVLQSVADEVAPVEVARRFAAARPDLVTLHEFEAAGHVRIWNRYQERYESVITDWLRATAASPGDLPAGEAQSAPRTHRA